MGKATGEKMGNTAGEKTGQATGEVDYTSPAYLNWHEVAQKVQAVLHHEARRALA
jgi:hypothetical protein